MWLVSMHQAPNGTKQWQYQQVMYNMYSIWYTKKIQQWICVILSLLSTQCGWPWNWRFEVLGSFGEDGGHIDWRWWPVAEFKSSMHESVRGCSQDKWIEHQTKHNYNSKGIRENTHSTAQPERSLCATATLEAFQVIYQFSIRGLQQHCCFAQRSFAPSLGNRRYSWCGWCDVGWCLGAFDNLQERATDYSRAYMAMARLAHGEAPQE